ncbi:MAG: MCE family protein [Bacteroidales bacterium]|nr:MCE family protein [Candidatus Sodaliphilus aphodohippi]
MKKIFNKNVLIAITVLISMCLLYWGIEYLKGINLFKPSNFYYVKFEKVDGLVQSAPVTINGFQVGQVREINYDYGTNQISVMLSMDKDLKIPIGTTAQIESSLTGTATMALQLSDSKAYYKVGDEIKSAPKQGIMDMVTGDVMPQINSILPRVDSIMGNVNALVANPALHTSISRLDAITIELAKSSQELTRLMNGLNRNIPGVMSNVSSITGNLNMASDNINELSGGLKTIPIDSTVNKLNATITNLQTLSNKLNDNNSSLGLLLNDKSLYNNANQAITSLDSLFVDIKKNPKRYINVKVF